MRSPTVICIVGASRSGSTLLDRLLGAAPEAVSMGEVHHLWDRGFIEDHLCGCGERFSECVLWQRVYEHADLNLSVREILMMQSRLISNRNLLAFTGRGRLSDELESVGQQYGAAIASIYESMADQSNARVLVDSSKRAVHAALLLRFTPLPVLVVHLTRDSRAVVWSLGARKAKADSGRDDQWMQELSLMNSVHGWIRSNLASDYVRMTSRGLRIRYEDLVARPEQTLDRVLGRVGLMSPPRTLEGLWDLGTAHSVSGNPMRLSKGPLRIQLDERWQREMPIGPRYLVTACTGPLLARYGYTIRASAIGG